jgi:hypothetical protein
MKGIIISRYAAKAQKRWKDQLAVNIGWRSDKACSKVQRGMC